MMVMMGVPCLESGKFWNSEIAKAAATCELEESRRKTPDSRWMLSTKRTQLNSRAGLKVKCEVNKGQREQVAEHSLPHSTGRSLDVIPNKINSQEVGFSHKSSQEVPLEAGLSLFGELDHIEQLWLQFFVNPLDWWDNRPNKANQLNGAASQEIRHFPDFKHKITREVLWEDSRLNPPWVKAKLANVTGCRQQAGKEIMLEKLWRKFFSNPSQWWDHRFDKANVRYPDFKHKESQESLWIDGRLTPKWVEAELAALSPGTLQRSVFSWNIKLSKFVKNRQYTQALGLYQRMQTEGVLPDKLTFVRVLNACAGAADLLEGRHVHARANQSNYQEHMIVGNCLIDMYGKCGSIEDACRVFDSMQTHDTVSWSVLIRAYMRCGHGEKGLILFQQMQRENFEPDIVTFVSILNACANIEALEEGRNIHCQVIQKGYEADFFVVNCLLDMYAKSGSIEDACKVFNSMSVQNEVAWSSMIGGYLKCGQGQKALELFGVMQQEGVEPDSVTFIVVLNACASVAALEEGRRVHAEVVQRGWESEIVVDNCLIDMYVKCGSIEDACKVFNAMSRHTVISWNAMIGGYAKCGRGTSALDLFRRMQLEQARPDNVTFVAALNSCASMLSLEEGRHIHNSIMQTEYRTNLVVQNSLIDMYSKCGNMIEACRVFNSMAVHDAVCWSALIGGYVKSGEGMNALEAFRQMELECIEPDMVTFVGVLNACACIAALEEGKRVHAKAEKALELFQQMQQNQVEADSVTFVGVLTACSSLAALDEGRCVHEQAIACGCDSDIFVANCLIDMYAKCGSIEEASNVFNGMQGRDVISWNTMIMAYAMHGLGEAALQLFAHGDVMMDKGTFVCLLTALSHAGLVDEGEYYFESICAIYCISIAVEHCSCMIDLLGRAGRLDEAENLINKMPCQPTLSVWTALLSACRVHDNLEIGERAAKQLLNLHPDNTSGYVMLSNMYAAAGKWDSKGEVEHLRTNRQAFKSQARTWIDANN
ncbi:hypothetical protein O6H91_13G045300 [Diphasiastrum complanatum]|uniref:Uncharacterized protein n=2 Tax=Diphasiastrum complanatum TaxID=34168 RepID=A0ACC2BUJ1_DIPCM|nr:hypothetical protein O6H91_13G045300 [Diphasiastrum complanatum]KAJ7533362.1 hypothetical protein O6H91_13G045300 [Diphasiastrum complanatum]